MKGIEVKQLQKKFHKQVVLEPTSFQLEPRKIYGLLGRNGAGKSTILNSLTNRILVSGGEVLVDGQSAFDNDQALRKMYLMSEKNLYPDSTKLIKLFHLTELFYGDFDYQQAYDLAADFELDLQQRFGKLSTGYRSIFKLIIALCVPAEYILFDEPTLGLDANHRELFYRALADNYLKRPRTFLIATHLIGEVASLLEQVLIVDHGKLLLDGQVESVLARSHLITGPTRQAAEYVAGLNVIGQEKLGKISSYYIYDNLDDSRPLPDTVSIEQLDLQQLFINLTNRRKDGK